MKTTRKMTLAYLSLLLNTVSTEIQLNPGPSCPCGSCGLEVLDDDAAVSCDKCEYWFHIQCQDISLATYDSLQADDSSFSWVCLKCDNQYYATVSSHSFVSFESENSFSVLHPDADNTRDDSPSSGLAHSQTCQSQSRFPKFPKLKIINVNFQSVKNMIPELHTLLDNERPDILIGNESWLTSDIQNCEILSPDLGYSIFREDRTSSVGGGVFILLKDNIIASEIPQFKTNCEVLWVKIELIGTKPLFTAAYYHPKEGDADSSEELKKSLELVSLQKRDIWVFGDLNYPKLDWDVDDAPIIKPGCSYTKLYDSFIETMRDFNLTQMVRKATRSGNILDLFFTTNPTLVNSVSVIPDLSDVSLTQNPK